MKNVLHFIGSFHTGGSERQAVQLARILREDGKFNVFLACLNRQGALLGEAEKAGFTDFPEFRLTSFYDFNFLNQIRKCARFLRSNRIDIVQTHDFYTNIFGLSAAYSAGVKLKIGAKRETFGVRSKAQRFIEKSVFRSADAIVANSEAVKKHLVGEGVSEKKIEVIYNGLDLERLTPRITDRREICEELGLPKDENIKFITLVANLRHNVKNQPMFLRAAQKVSRKFPNAHFVLAGEGELRESLENLAQDLQIIKNTHFIGRCSKIPELLSISFAGVLTSFHEGFSNSILEYMAASLPVVATNVGGANEAIIENETGFLVGSDDDKKMSERLIELLGAEEKSRKFGKRGREFVEEKFSLKAQLEKTLALYNKKSLNL